jgi:hypothetical protein
MNTKMPGGRPTPRRTPQASDDKLLFSCFQIFKGLPQFLGGVLMGLTIPKVASLGQLGFETMPL